MKVLLMGFIVWNINICVLYSINVISRNSEVMGRDVEATIEFYPSLIGL